MTNNTITRNITALASALIDRDAAQRRLNTAVARTIVGSVVDHYSGAKLLEFATPDLGGSNPPASRGPILVNVTGAGGALLATWYDLGAPGDTALFHHVHVLGEHFDAMDSANSVFVQRGTRFFLAVEDVE